MLRERAAGCGDTRQLPGPPRVACESSREGVKIIHARRHPCWNVTLSYAVAWRAPCAPERPPKPLSPCDASITRPAPATISATGSRGIRLRRLHSAASWPLSWWAVMLMSQPKKARGRPPGRPESRPAEIAPASADREPPAGPASTRIVSQGGRKRRAARRRESLIVRASVYAPCPRRTLWAFAYVCPWCGLGHLGRARTEDEIAGPRRSRCGHLVIVRVARVYRGRAAQEVA